MAKRFNRPSRGYASFESALNGVALYQQKHHNDLITPTITHNKQSNYFGLLSKLIREFLKIKELPIKDNGSYLALEYNANVVQDNFSVFKQWLKEYKHDK